MITLTRQELVELTDYRRRDKQREALAAMRIPFEITPAGGIKVLRSQTHPDRNSGDESQFCRVQRAWERYQGS